MHIIKGLFSLPARLEGDIDGGRLAVPGGAPSPLVTHGVGLVHGVFDGLDGGQGPEVGATDPRGFVGRLPFLPDGLKISE